MDPSDSARRPQCECVLYVLYVLFVHLPELLRSNMHVLEAFFFASLFLGRVT